MSRLKNAWFFLRNSFCEQLKREWLTIIPTIILAVLGTWLSISYNAAQENEYSSPLFKYSYDQNAQSVGQDVGSNFSALNTTWLVPETDATSTGYAGNSLSLQKIMEVIINNQDSQGNFLNPFGDKNVQGYMRCEILSEFSSNDKVEGFPIGVITNYVIKGETKVFDSRNPGVRTNYDLVLLRDFSNGSVQTWTIPNVSYPYLKGFLLQNGNDELARVMKIDPYDSKKQYLNDDGTCRQTGEEFVEVPLK